MKGLAWLGAAGLADAISQGRVLRLFDPESDAHAETDKLPEDSELAAKIDEKAQEIAEKINLENPGMEQREKTMILVDYCGAALFAWGIRDLMDGGHGHVHQYHYGVLAALSGIKYQLSNEAERHHLREETTSNAKALGIIAGTIVMAEGINMDVKVAYEAAAGKNPEKSDRVALMTMLASVLSPLATTVGSASVIRQMSNDLCAGDKSMMAVCTSHISNLSGFLLFGDPPFIAICEKYGFAEGIKWQFEAAFPLAIYSLISSTFKLNLILAKQEGLSGKQARKKALSESLSGIRRNLPILGKIIGKSLGNISKYFSALDLKYPQDAGGLELRIGEVLLEKFNKISKLPFSEELDHSGHEEHGGIVRGDKPRVRGAHEMVAGIIKEMSRGREGRVTGGEEDEETGGWEGARTEGEGDEETGGREGAPTEREVLEELTGGRMDGEANPDFACLERAIEDRDYEKVQEIGDRLGTPNMEIFIRCLRDYDDNQSLDESIEPGNVRYTIKQRLNPLEIYLRITSMHRIKNAIGHNLGDVVDVFPFQAECVKFLIRVFSDISRSMEIFPNNVREAIMFFLIMILSSIADNYVACKIGLEIFPDKPHLPLIASIQGGSLTAIGNMANVAQFDLKTMPFGDSLKQIGVHIDSVGAAFAWSKALDILKETGILVPPKAIKRVGSEEVKSGGSEEVTVETRREFFAAMLGQRSGTERV